VSMDSLDINDLVERWRLSALWASYVDCHLVQVSDTPAPAAFSVNLDSSAPSEIQVLYTHNNIYNNLGMFHLYFDGQHSSAIQLACGSYLPPVTESFPVPSPFGISSVPVPTTVVNPFDVGDYTAIFLATWAKSLRDRNEFVDKEKIASDSVSKGGNLSHLPAYEQEALEADAQDQVTHFEPITLAEEREEQDRSARTVLRLFRYGWSLCEKLYSNGFTIFSPRAWAATVSPS